MGYPRMDGLLENPIKVNELGVLLFQETNQEESGQKPATVAYCMRIRNHLGTINLCLQMVLHFKIRFRLSIHTISHNIGSLWLFHPVQFGLSCSFVDQQHNDAVVCCGSISYPK